MPTAHLTHFCCHGLSTHAGTRAAADDARRGSRPDPAARAGAARLVGLKKNQKSLLWRGTLSSTNYLHRQRHPSHVSAHNECAQSIDVAAENLDASVGVHDGLVGRCCIVFPVSCRIMRAATLASTASGYELDSHWLEPPHAIASDGGSVATRYSAHRPGQRGRYVWKLVSHGWQLHHNPVEGLGPAVASTYVPAAGADGASKLLECDRRQRIAGESYAGKVRNAGKRTLFVKDWL